jgi:hypothetical protein
VTLGAWWREREQKNAPHIGRGTLVALVFWIVGAVSFGPHWAATLSFAGTLAASMAWEGYDYLRGIKSDGWDWYDIAADMTGWLLFQLSILAYEFLDVRGLWTWANG